MKRQLSILEGFRIFASDAQFVFGEKGEVTLIDSELFTIIPGGDAKAMREVLIEHRWPENLRTIKARSALQKIKAAPETM